MSLKGEAEGMATQGLLEGQLPSRTRSPKERWG
jgi:hypothetical protein